MPTSHDDNDNDADSIIQFSDVPRTGWTLTSRPPASGQQPQQQNPSKPATVVVDIPCALPLDPHRHPYFNNLYNHANPQIHRLSSHKFTEIIPVPFWVSYNQVYDSFNRNQTPGSNPGWCLAEPGMPLGLWEQAEEVMTSETEQLYQTYFDSIEATTHLEDQVVLMWLGESFSMPDLMELGGDIERFNFVVVEAWEDIKGTPCQLGVYLWLVWLRRRVLDRMPVKAFVEVWWLLMNQKRKDVTVEGGMKAVMEFGCGGEDADHDVSRLGHFRTCCRRRHRHRGGLRESASTPTPAPAEYDDLFSFLAKCYQTEDRDVFSGLVVVPTVRRVMRTPGSEKDGVVELLTSPWWSSKGEDLIKRLAVKKSWDFSGWCFHRQTRQTRYARQRDKEQDSSQESSLASASASVNNSAGPENPARPLAPPEASKDKRKRKAKPATTGSAVAAATTKKKTLGRYDQKRARLESSSSSTYPLADDDDVAVAVAADDDGGDNTDDTEYLGSDSMAEALELASRMY